jgi:hypothetical protein
MGLGVGSYFASFLRSWIQLTRRSQELGQANEMAGGHGEGEHGADLVEAAHLQSRATVLPQPKHSSIRLRSRWLIA